MTELRSSMTRDGPIPPGWPASEGMKSARRRGEIFIDSSFNPRLRWVDEHQPHPLGVERGDRARSLISSRQRVPPSRRRGRQLGPPASSTRKAGDQSSRHGSGLSTHDDRVAAAHRSRVRSPEGMRPWALAGPWWNVFDPGPSSPAPSRRNVRHGDAGAATPQARDHRSRSAIRSPIRAPVHVESFCW